MLTTTDSRTGAWASVCSSQSACARRQAQLPQPLFAGATPAGIAEHGVLAALFADADWNDETIRHDLTVGGLDPLDVATELVRAIREIAEHLEISDRDRVQILEHLQGWAADRNAETGR
jgi:hypothetical protein